MAVTARFKVARKVPLGVTYDPDTKQWSKQGATGDDVDPWGWELEMTPDYAEGKNAEWAAATPSGMIRMTIKNELAAKQFEPGDSYEIVFNKLED
jgi:hypothetical protein